MDITTFSAASLNGCQNHNKSEQNHMYIRYKDI